MDAAMLAAGVACGERFSSERLGVGIIGRWAAGLLRGRCRHADIMEEPPVSAEAILGLATHYGTGIALTGVFLLLPGRHGASRALAYGVATSLLPLLVLFPSLGYGPFGSRSGEASRLISTMLVGHVAFGTGIALGTTALLGNRHGR